VSNHGVESGLLVKISLVLIAAMISAQAAIAQPSEANRRIAPPGLKEIQVPFASLKPEAIFKIGENADWVQVTDDAVWVASSKPASVHRIDPKTNKEVAVIPLPGDPCAGLAFGFGSLWVPLCGRPNSIARVDANANRISAILPIGPAGPEGGIAASTDSVWVVRDDTGTLARIDPATNKVRQSISIAPGSYNPCFSEDTVWITGGAANLLTAVDARTGDVRAAIPVGPMPRFLTAGAGSIWTLNQGDGTVTRIDALTTQGCDRLLVVPLYPQYSAATSATVCDEVFRVLAGQRAQPTLRVTPPYYDDPDYIEALAVSINAHLATLPFQPELIVASFHGMPQKYVDKGDPYQAQCVATTDALRKRMGLDAAKLILTFQSRFGFDEWLRPYTDKTIEKLAKDGVKRIAVVTPGFSADCLETLEEIAVENAHVFHRHGGENFFTIPCLNDSPPGMLVLGQMALRELKGWI